MAAILVIDSSPTIRETLRIVLGSEHALTLAPSWEDVVPGAHADVVVFGAPPASRDPARFAALRARIAPDAPLLLLNAAAEVDARALAPAGHRIAFLPKPFDAYRLRMQVAALLAPAPRSTPSERVVSWHRQWVASPLLARPAATLARRAIPTDLPVSLLAEHGTGAVEVARAIHFFSGRGGSVLVRAARHLGSDILGTGSAAIGALVIEDAQDLLPEAQASLLALLRDPDDGAQRPRIFVTSATELDAAVAHGTFAPALAQALAALPIVLAPLRERTTDIPAIVALFAASLAERLRLEPIVFTEPALTRLQHYLWFGNVAELEAVIARTLAVHRPRLVEPEMLVFGIADAARLVSSATPTAPSQPRTEEAAERPHGEPAPEPAASPTRPRVVPMERRRSEESPSDGEPSSVITRARPDDGATVAAGPSLEVLLGELAHELRNPMVTIKTFAQHLDSVLDDAEVRARFATLTGDAITRMDTLLEFLLDFARFRAPVPTAIDLAALATRALDERTDELGRKDVRVERAAFPNGTILVNGDELQVLFALRSLVDGLVRDLIAHAPVRLGIRTDGSLELTVHAERAVAARLAGYVADGEQSETGAPPPLAFTIAATLLRRNRGRLETRPGTDGTTIVTVSLPRAAARAEGQG